MSNIPEPALPTAHTAAEPAAIVIFGASGDLAQRKLAPALHALACQGLLPKGSRIVGVARSNWTDQSFRDHLYEGILNYSRARAQPGNCALWPQSASRHFYMPGEYDDPETYRQLSGRLAEADVAAHTAGNRLFCLATPPFLYPAIIDHLGKAGLNRSQQGWVRIMIEKPFGRDGQSARLLNGQIHTYFDEDQVYRIDHYLGKETAQNILYFRFANTIFETVWNHRFIDHVQITVAESVDVGLRAGYYNGTGVLRDMFQNHLLQLLALVAMESPGSLQPEAVRNARTGLLSCLRPLSVAEASVHTVRGQYHGYRETPGIRADSQTATYAAVRLFIDNERWQGVPFFLRSGKAMAAKSTMIVVHFKNTPHLLLPGLKPASNVLSLFIQPDEGICLSMTVKNPLPSLQTSLVPLTFRYADAFGSDALPDAYERLLLDALRGDASLFTRNDGIDMAWRFIDPIAASWEIHDTPPLTMYGPGTWGPKEADALPAGSGRHWTEREQEQGNGL